MKRKLEGKKKVRKNCLIKSVIEEKRIRDKKEISQGQKTQQDVDVVEGSHVVDSMQMNMIGMNER